MIDSIPLEALRGIGLAQPVFQQFLDLAPLPGDKLMRVTEVQRDRLTLDDGFGACAAQPWPTLRVALQMQQDALAVGDWVQARTDTGTTWAVARLAPATRLTRRDPSGLRQVLACNVDTALLAMGLDGDYNLRRLDRYLALVRIAGVLPVVVLTKADLCAAAGERRAEVRGHLGGGVGVVAVDARAADSVEVLSPWLAPGRTLVLLGSSGAGKSTLTNTLTSAGSEPASQATGPVRRGDERGRHTTTARSLHRCAHGACLIDTPGLRSLHLDADAKAVAAAFDDIADLQAACRFRNCRHAGEPGCAVREALPDERIASYHKLLREARRDQLSFLDKRELQSEWKARSRAARMHLDAKRR